MMLKNVASPFYDKREQAPFLTIKMIKTSNSYSNNYRKGYENILNYPEL